MSQGAPTQSKQQTAALALPQPTTNTRGSGEETAGKWAMFFLVAIGIFMATLDSSIVNISLPTMARTFGVPLSGAVEWVIIAYLVTTTAILLTAGRLADMIGRKVVWTAGLMIFTASSALCGLAPSLGMLIADFPVTMLILLLLLSISSVWQGFYQGKMLGLQVWSKR